MLAFWKKDKRADTPTEPASPRESTSPEPLPDTFAQPAPLQESAPQETPSTEKQDFAANLVPKNPPTTLAPHLCSLQDGDSIFEDRAISKVCPSAEHMTARAKIRTGWHDLFREYERLLVMARREDKCKAEVLGRYGELLEEIRKECWVEDVYPRVRRIVEESLDRAELVKVYRRMDLPEEVGIIVDGLMGKGARADTGAEVDAGLEAEAKAEVEAEAKA